MDIEGTERITKCTECKKSFSNLSNLRRHVRQSHPNKIQDIAPLFYKNKSNFQFSCGICNKNFNIKRYLRHHLKSHEQVEKPSNSTSEEILNRYSKKCPLCHFYDSKAEEMLKHFEHVHDIIVNDTDMEFTSLNDFQQWLMGVEKKTQSKFVKKGTKAFKNHIATMYVCHRSGDFVPQGKGLRSLKIKGSVKINGYCPASIKLIQNHNGICHAHAIETHVGHSSDNNVEYLYLTKEEREKLAFQISNKIPFEEILYSFRNPTTDSRVERINLVKRKDLYNIEKSFNLTSNSVKHCRNNKEVDKSGPTADVSIKEYDSYLGLEKISSLNNTEKSFNLTLDSIRHSKIIIIADESESNPDIPVRECGSCNKQVEAELFCEICNTVYHESCVALLKDFKILGCNRLICAHCKEESESNSTFEITALKEQNKALTCLVEDLQEKNKLLCEKVLNLEGQIENFNKNFKVIKPSITLNSLAECQVLYTL